MKRALFVGALVACAGAAVAPPASADATFQIVSNDGAGEGLNDPTPVVPVGGNAATTLGSARRRALAYALSQVACHIDSVVPIQVEVDFNALPCDATSAVLASTGASTVVRDFPNAARVSTYYPVALANALAGVDLDPQ